MSVDQTELMNAIKDQLNKTRITNTQSVGCDLSTVQGPGCIAIAGHRAYMELLERIDRHTCDRYDPHSVFLIGKNDDRIALRDELVKENIVDGDGSDRKLQWPAGTDVAEYGEVEFSLSSRENADKLIYDVRTPPAGYPPIAAVVLLYQEGLCKELPYVMEKCPELTIYTVLLGSEHTFEKVYFGPDGEGLPAGVDLNAQPAEEVGGIPDIPMDAMYGKAYDYAKLVDTKLGLSYLGVLVAACGVGIKASGAIRPTLYGVELTDVGGGKSATSDRVLHLMGLRVEAEPGEFKTDERCIYWVPASDQGLYKMLPKGDSPARGACRLIHQDEMRNMMQKGNIENSSLISVLCTLFNSNEAGGADKTSKYDINCKLSILGNVKIKHPSEFSKVFGYATAHGLYDRCLFGVDPAGDYNWRDWDRKTTITFAPSTPTVSPDIYDAVYKWREVDRRGRKRLGELVLRVAYVSSAINGDDHVTDKALFAALRFIEWQERLRFFYQPAKGATEREECVQAIKEVFRKSPGMWGYWRDLARKHHWSERFPHSLTAVKKLLTQETAELVRDKTSKKEKYYLAEGVQANG